MDPAVNACVTHGPQWMNWDWDKSKPLTPSRPVGCLHPDHAMANNGGLMEKNEQNVCVGQAHEPLHVTLRRVAELLELQGNPEHQSLRIAAVRLNEDAIILERLATARGAVQGIDKLLIKAEVDHEHIRVILPVYELMKFVRPLRRLLEVSP